MNYTKTMALSLLLAGILANPCLYAQKKGTAYTELTWNNTTVSLSNDGTFFTTESGAAGYKVPANGNTATIYSTGLWMSGISFTGMIRAAANKNKDAKTDYFPGPLKKDNPSEYDESVAEEYDRFFLITAEEIQNHKDSFNTFGYIPVPNIAEWPGNPPSDEYYSLAPYEDVNQNGEYDPINGDYPKIKGDFAALTVINDVGVHAITDADPTGSMIQLMFYGYHSASSPLAETVFLNMQIIQAYSGIDNFVVGLYNDFDLGNHTDDYVGTLYDRDAIYVYNGDGFDEDGFVPGYGDVPPTQAVAFLNQKIGSSIQHYPNGFGSPALWEPAVVTDYYYSMNAKWRDGSDMLYGGNGHVSSMNAPYPEGPVNSNSTSKFMFPGDSDPEGESTKGNPQYGKSEYWSETTAGNIPGDRRMMITSEPMQMSKGDTFSLDVAFVFSQTAEGKSELDKLKEDIDQVKAKYNGTTSLTQVNSLQRVLVYPNPVKGNYFVAEGVGKVQLMDLLGKRVEVLQEKNRVFVNEVPNGTYFLLNEEGQMLQKVVIAK